jgi:DNA-binding winged helix-turn-helix (wHTH) protein/tetratricopeptide (TPR) repeat protein
MDDTNRRPTPSPAAIYRFGLFTLDVTSGLLTRNGIRVKLQDQPLQLLTLLLERNAGIVSREEIRLRLWQGNTFVDFDKSLGVAVLKVREALGDSAANPRFLETVPRRGYRFIAPVSVEISSVTSASATSISPVETTLDEPAPPEESTAAHDFAPTAPAPLPKPDRSKLWYVAAGLCAALALGFAIYRFHLASRPAMASTPASPTALKLRRSVAVLGFRNVTGGPDHNWLSTAFTEMLNTELASSGDLRMVSGEDVANVKHDLSLAAEDTLAKSTLARLRSNLEADVVVVGSYTLLGYGEKKRIRLDIRAQDTALGETIYEGAITGNEDDLFDLASQAGSRIRESLNPSVGSAPPTEATRFPGSSNQLALQLYSEGRARIYQFDFVGARDFLKRAVTADPDFALAHSALASAMSSLGYEVQARAEAQRALQHSRGLTQESALVIQGQYQESIRDWPNAALTYRKLFDLFPDDLSYGLRLAATQLHVSPADASHTLATLRKLPSPVGDDPRIDLMEASVLIGRDLPKARASAQKAIAKASAQGATLMIARGFGILCQLDWSLGVGPDQSVSDCNLARNSFIGAGDGNNAARTLNDLAGFYYQHGDLDRAESMWNEAIVVFRKVGDTEGIAASSNNVGDVLLARGKLAEAQTLLQQALAGYKLAGDRSGTALALVDLGEIALDQANLPAAKSDYEQSIALGHATGDMSATAFGLAGLGDVLAEQDQLPAARKQYDDALKLRQDLGEKQTILETRVAIARLVIEEGHAQEAELEIRKCRDEIRQQQFLDDELEADIELVRALLAQSKVDDAKREVVALRPLEEKTQHRELQLRTSLELARTLAAEHDLRSSQTLLNTVSREADASGFAVLAWEAQTVRASLQGEAGDQAGAVRQLKSLEASERNAGLQLKIREAHAMAKVMAASGK